NHGGPYPVGPVEILVAEDDLDVARALLVETDELDGDPDGQGIGTADRRAPFALWATVAVVVVVALVLLGRAVAMAPSPPTAGRDGDGRGPRRGSAAKSTSRVRYVVCSDAFHTPGRQGRPRARPRRDRGRGRLLVGIGRRRSGDRHHVHHGRRGRGGGGR